MTKCRVCDILIADNYPYDACNRCSRTHGRCIRDDFTDFNGIHRTVCHRCLVPTDAAKQHVCLPPEPEKPDREKDIESLIRSATYSSRLFKLLWEEISDLRSRLDNREIEEDIVPEMQRWEQELGN